MKATDLPTSFPIPWAFGANAPYIRPIPQASQIGIQAGAASLTDGFPPVTFIPEGAGGTPPFGADANGILNQVSAWCRWQEAGGPVGYDGTFSAAIGGYPKSALIRAAIFGNFWISTIDDNTSNPDAGGAGWETPPGMMSPGFPIFRFDNSNVPGAVLANAQTIGNDVSGATSATADNFFIFQWAWNNFSNAQCPVSGGRGANAIADFNAGKQLTILDLRGTGIQGVDTMGGGATTLLSGVPVVSGSRSAPGSVLGENLHTLVLAEIAAHFHAAFLNDLGHFHTYNRPFNTSLGSGLDSAFWQNNVSSSNTSTATSNVSLWSGAGGTGTQNQTANSGGGGAHNTVQRSMLVNVWLKQ